MARKEFLMTTTSPNNPTLLESNENTFVGIDIAKEELVVHVLPTNQKLTVPNSDEGIKKLVALFKENKPKQILFEATGALERELLANLVAHGLIAVAMNPKQARDLAKGLGKLAKTDAVDAHILAQIAQLQVIPARDVPTHETREMSDLVTRRQQLVGVRTMEANRLQQATRKAVLDSIAKVVDFLNEQIKDIDNRIKKMIDENPDWSARDKILQSMPGVGPKTSQVLISAMPELGSVNRQEASALAGVAPFCDDSGKRSGTKHIKGGRAHVRSALFMATLSAIKWNPTIKEFYERLMAAGKKHKVAMVAAMRKMLAILNVMVKTNTCWQERRAPAKN
jgi:transposase